MPFIGLALGNCILAFAAHPLFPTFAPITLCKARENWGPVTQGRGRSLTQSKLVFWQRAGAFEAHTLAGTIGFQDRPGAPVRFTLYSLVPPEGIEPSPVEYKTTMLAVDTKEAYWCGGGVNRTPVDLGMNQGWYHSSLPRIKLK